MTLWARNFVSLMFIPSKFLTFIKFTLTQFLAHEYTSVRTSCCMKSDFSGKKLFRSHKLSPALYPKDVRVMGAQKWDCQKMGAAHDFISGEPICSDAYFLNNKKCARFQLNLFFFGHGQNILWSSNYLRWAFKSIMGEAPIFRPVLFFTPIVLSLGCLYVYII